MGRKCIDLTGRRFGRLVVVERAENGGNRHARWVCRCDCGETANVSGGFLRRGRTLSCGCIRREIAPTHARTTHCASKTRLYRIWGSMKDRCTNPESTNYANYGGRGVTVCAEWKNSFEAFQKWALGNGYSDSLTLDRNNPSGGYYPDNCRWASQKAQQNNRRNNRRLTYNGETHTTAEWAEKIGISRQALYQRLKHGWSIEYALMRGSGYARDQF